MSEAFRVGGRPPRAAHASAPPPQCVARRALSSSRWGGDTGAGWRPDAASRCASAARCGCPPAAGAPSPSRRGLCLDAWAQEHSQRVRGHVQGAAGRRPSPASKGRHNTRLLSSSLPGPLPRPGAPVSRIRLHDRRRAQPHEARCPGASAIPSRTSALNATSMTCHRRRPPRVRWSGPQGREVVDEAPKVRPELRARRTTAAAPPTRLGWPRASRRAGGHPARRALSQGGVPACTAGRKSPGREAESASLSQARPCTKAATCCTPPCPRGVGGDARHCCLRSPLLGHGGGYARVAQAGDGPFVHSDVVGGGPCPPPTERGLLLRP